MNPSKCSSQDPSQRCTKCWKQIHFERSCWRADREVNQSPHVRWASDFLDAFHSKIIIVKKWLIKIPRNFQLHLRKYADATTKCLEWKKRNCLWIHGALQGNNNKNNLDINEMNERATERNENSWKKWKLNWKGVS